MCDLKYSFKCILLFKIKYLKKKHFNNIIFISYLVFIPYSQELLWHSVNQLKNNYKIQNNWKCKF